MEETEVRDPEDPEKTEKICVICHDKTKPILNKRSQTCRRCYQAWRAGTDHPTLGKFTASQVHNKSKIKTAAIEKANPGHPPKPEESPISRSYPFPDIVTLDFSKYLEIKAVIFERAIKLKLPRDHVIMSFLAGAIESFGTAK